MEKELKDIVHSNTYGGNLWLLQIRYEYCEVGMYRVLARRRLARLSEMRLGQKVKVHANILLLLEKGGMWGIFTQNVAWPN